MSHARLPVLDFMGMSWLVGLDAYQEPFERVRQVSLQVDVACRLDVLHILEYPLLLHSV